MKRLEDAGSAPASPVFALDQTLVYTELKIFYARTRRSEGMFFPTPKKVADIP